MIQPISVFLELDLDPYKNKFFSGAKNENRKTLNVPIAWDIETSTDGSRSWMYAFGFSFDGVAYLGRTWYDFEKVLDKLTTILSEKRVITIFVHNLGFEFFFFKHRLPIVNTFFKSSKKPIIVELGGRFYGIIFKDSMAISGYSLRDWASACSFQIQKGELDYSIERTPETQLTPEEESYIERDVLIVDEGIRKLIPVLPYEKKNVGSIPLTKTQIVKAEMLKGCMASYTFKKICRESEPDLETLQFMKLSFRGGSIGANCPYMIYDDVTRYDISSQYPFELLTRRYPIGKAETVENPSDRDLEAALEFDYLFLIEFQAVNVVRKPGYPKFLQTERANHFWMTSVDFKIFHFIYDYEILRINRITFWRRSDLIFPQIRKFILEKYEKKTQLKGVESQEFIYNHEKSNLNTIAGLLSTYPLRDTFSRFGDRIPLEPEEQLKEYYNGMPRIPYQFGLFMVSWARRSLWNAIRKIGLYRTIYFDTDCIDVVGEADDIIEDLNKERLDALIKIGYTETDISPADQNGEIHTIGFFEKKWTGARFCALAPKCYCVELPDGLKAVVGGCSIEKKIEHIHSIEQFTSDDLVIPDGLRSSEYIDEPFEFVKNSVKIGEKSYVTIRNNDFEIRKIKSLANFGFLEVEE